MTELDREGLVTYPLSKTTTQSESVIAMMNHHGLGDGASVHIATLWGNFDGVVQSSTTVNHIPYSVHLDLTEQVGIGRPMERTGQRATIFVSAIVAVIR
jgi:hypothetical protein